MYKYSFVYSLASDPNGVLGIDVSQAFSSLCNLGNICPAQPGGYQGLPALDPMWAYNDPGRFDTTGEWRFDSAIQLATTCKLPPDQATLAMERADANTIGALAVLALRVAGWLPAAVECRGLGSYFCPVCGNPISDASAVVSFSDYYDCRNPQCLWREDTGLVNGFVSRRIWAVGKDGIPADSRLGRLISDPMVSLARRVQAMEQWLLAGEETQVF